MAVFNFLCHLWKCISIFSCWELKHLENCLPFVVNSLKTCWHPLFLRLNSSSLSCIFSLWKVKSIFTLNIPWSDFTTLPLNLVNVLSPLVSIFICEIRGRIWSQTTKTSMIVSSMHSLVWHTLVMSPSHIGRALITLKCGILDKKSLNNFPFWFCFLGSLLIIPLPAHRFPSICKTTAAPSLFALCIYGSIYCQKHSFLFFFIILLGSISTYQCHREALNPNFNCQSLSIIVALAYPGRIQIV